MNRIIPLIIRWYAENGKPLPWRTSPDPYHVWISEIMLQQTRIEAVIPYYSRFLAELPDVCALAEVPDDRLMKLWEGLGYYSRARNLKKAAEVIVSRYGGKLPESAEELRSLPGIGDYTAGAVASIAFGQPEPAVDGNVLRVYCRIFAREDDIALERTKKSVREELKRVYPTGEDARLLTEGLMELGEVICIPNGEPKCADCPVRAHCLAHQRRETDRYPVKSAKKSRRIEEKTVFLLSCGGSYALRKRDNAGLLAGMWEFPGADGHLTPDEAGEFLRKLGLSPVKLQPCGVAKHIFTHVEWHMTGYAAEIAGSTAQYPAMEQNSGITFVPADRIREEFAVPAAFRAYTAQMT